MVVNVQRMTQERETSPDCETATTDISNVRGKMLSEKGRWWRCMGRKEFSSSFERPKTPLLFHFDTASDSRSSSEIHSTVNRNAEQRSVSLFARLAQRRSQTTLQVRCHEICALRSRGKLNTPKIVRAGTIHIQETEKSLDRSRKLSVHGLISDYSSGKKPSKSQPHGRHDEINRIFKANKLRRKIGFDILLDNYKERMQNEAQEERRGDSRPFCRPQKVFAAGKFIGYLKTSAKLKKEQKRGIGNACKSYSAQNRSKSSISDTGTTTARTSITNQANESLLNPNPSLI